MQMQEQGRYLLANEGAIRGTLGMNQARVQLEADVGGEEGPAEVGVSLNLSKNNYLSVNDVCNETYAYK